jgi:transposase-like protein
MENKLAELIGLAKRVPETEIDKAAEALREIIDEANKAKKATAPKCVKCGAGSTVRNGHKHGKQAYLCKACGASFVETTGNALYYSHSGESVWKQVIRDTLNGVSIDKTAEQLDLTHPTVFNMRHKVLLGIEQRLNFHEEPLSGVCEFDETYVLESEKGSKMSGSHPRGPRKHGAKARKRGISGEYISICAGIERGGRPVSKAVNRATPSCEDILTVFGDIVAADALVLCDGAKSYAVLEREGKCSVKGIDTAERPTNQGFYHINSVNGYHSFIKERYLAARGFATKYLNRYNALFTLAYKQISSTAEDIFETLVTGIHNTIADVRNRDLLEI